MALFDRETFFDHETFVGPEGEHLERFRVYTTTGTLACEATGPEDGLLCLHGAHDDTR